MHEVFVEFCQDSRPMAMPPTLYNGGNAIEQAKEVIFQASLAANEKEARDDDGSYDEMDEKVEGDGE
eukprot:3217007-Rhodomonas_salina.1